MELPKLNNAKRLPATEKEKQFLRYLGIWSRSRSNPEGTRLSRLELLLRYQKTLHLWGKPGEINKARIARYVSELIAETRRGGRRHD